MVKGFKLCLIDQCGGNAHWSVAGARGWCRKHYHRLKRHGDPLKGGTETGAPMRFIDEVALIHVEAECLLWPYGKSQAGYAAIYDGKSMIHAGRIVCEKVYGPAPTASHVAAHSCGNGHNACISPKHLRWATNEENTADMIAHGTSTKGEVNPNAKLQREDVFVIRGLRGRMPIAQIATIFGIQEAHVSNIHNGKRWGWLK